MYLFYINCVKKIINCNSKYHPHINKHDFVSIRHISYKLNNKLNILSCEFHLINRPNMLPVECLSGFLGVGVRADPISTWKIDCLRGVSIWTTWWRAPGGQSRFFHGNSMQRNSTPTNIILNFVEKSTYKQTLFHTIYTISNIHTTYTILLIKTY